MLKRKGILMPVTCIYFGKKKPAQSRLFGKLPAAQATAAGASSSFLAAFFPVSLTSG
jgi:hypothetical protein